MITRLTHAAIAFAVTAALYQGYVVAVAPFVEPAWRSENAALHEPAKEIVASAEALHRYRNLLAAYFPPEHWCFVRPPKALDNGQALIIFDEYAQSQSGELRVPLCAVIFFPRPRQGADQPPRDAVILESTGGAVLQMEAQVDKAVNGFGRMQHGRLAGKVTIRSDMREPGPQDDLLLTTRDLYMNEDLIHTVHPVDMKLGAHHGFGRELEIRFMKTETSGGMSMGAIYGKFEDLLVKHDVSVSVAPGKMSFFGEPSDKATPTTVQKAEPPIRIRSAGPFRIDFAAEAASFSDQVEVRQLHPDGKLDELLADELKLFFTRTMRWNDGDDGAAAASGDDGQSMAFEPASIEALGSPVTLKAPSREATARGGRLWIELGPRRLTLEEGDEVTLTHQGAEIHAPMIQYQLPPKDSEQQVGAMAARGGAGWLRAAVDPAQPAQILEVRWTDAMQLVRRQGQPVLVLDGRPRVSLTGTGTLWADRLQIFLRETADGEAGQSSKGLNSLAASVSPERITASGRVAIESAQLTGKVNQLEVDVDHGRSGPADDRLRAVPVSSGGGNLGPSPSAASQPMAMFNPRSGAPPGKSYDIEGVTLKLNVALRDKRPEVRAINVDGNVVFKETSTVTPGEEPLKIVAEQLTVAGADTPNSQITIRGGSQNGVPQQNAEISARGAKLLVPAITLNRGSSEAVVNSPGEVHLLVNRDLTGAPLPQPEPLTIAWQDSMKLEGRRLTFLGDVHVQHASGWLRTRRLVAQTLASLAFDGGSQPPQLEQLECWEGALAEFEQRDVTGVTSRQRIELQSLIANQATGALSGAGPGKIDSVHLAKGAGGLMTLPGAGAGPAAPRLMQAQDEVKLRHLHIDFVRGVSGNLHTKTVNVEGNVEAVYGPIESWDQRLAMSAVGAPGPDVVWITSDKLGVTESPLARLGPAGTRQVELKAEGNVVIEGQDQRRTMFNATGHRATFDQSKGLFILEGDGRQPATISQQSYLGAPTSPQSAQRMSFNQNTGIVEIQGLHKGQFNQLPQQTRQPGTVR